MKYEENDVNEELCNQCLNASKRLPWFLTELEFLNRVGVTHKKIPGFEPKVVVHHLTLKHEVHPIKQSQCSL